MPINKFLNWSKKFLTPKAKLDQAPRTAGENPQPDFRQTGSVPEDASNFPVNK